MHLHTAFLGVPDGPVVEGVQVEIPAQSLLIRASTFLLKAAVTPWASS